LTLKLKFSKRVYLTYLLIAVNLGLFILENYLGGSQNLEVLHQLGGLVSEDVIAGQWWRVITANFLHFGWPHFLTNMLGLYIFGRLVESYMGTVKYLIIYLMSGIGAMSLYTYWSLKSGITNYLLVGASAAIMGLVGSLLAIFIGNWLRKKSRANSQKLQRLTLLIGLQFMLDQVVPQVSSLSHLFGLMIGFILGLQFLVKA